MGFRYFEKLNYTLANEDPSLEAHILAPNRERVVAVGGSGSRVLPLLSKGPRELHIVDISKVQLALCELRVETLRLLSQEEFLRFWYPWVFETPDAPLSTWRKKKFEEARISEESAEILRERFSRIGWEAITLTGKWEKTFQFFSRLSALFLGQKTLSRLFSFQDMEAQKRFFREEFPMWRFRLLIRIAGSAKTFNALLYRGGFPKNNTGVPYVKYYERAYLKLFHNGLASRNFFLQLSLLGKILNRESLPLEADPEIYLASKQGLSNAAIFYHHGDLVQVVQGLRNVDFVSISNVPSYFTGDLERSFLLRMRPSLRPGGRLVIRHYLHHPEGLDRSGFQDVSGEFSGAISSEKIQMYAPEILEARS